MAADEGDRSEDEPVESLAERANPLVSSLCAGLASEDDETRERSSIGLCLIAQHQPTKTSTIIGRLVGMVVGTTAEPIVRALATLRGEHGREIRGALMTETGYSNARKLYGVIEHAEPFDLSDIDVELPEGDEQPSFFSAVMRLIELEDENRDPLDSDAWTMLIEQLPGEGGEGASEEEIKQAATREGSRPRTVRRQHKRLQQIANSRVFRLIIAHSRFDDLEVLSGVRKRRFGTAIRTRGRIGTEEYAVDIRLCHELDEPGFARRLGVQLSNWQELRGESVVEVFDYGDSPRPWIATAVVDGTLAGQRRLSMSEALEHAQTLTQALTVLHRGGLVHGGIDPKTVGYPPNTFDRVVEPMFDNVGIVPVYQQHAEPGQYLDPRYGAPEQFDDQFGRIDRATDIYQLGMVLYRALTGRPPFEGDAESVREQVRTAQPDPPSEVTDAVPEQLDEIIAKATAKQKLLRYENATRFHHDVRTVCSSHL